MGIMTEKDTSAVLPLWNQLVAPRKGAALDHREERAFQVAGWELDNILEEGRWTNDRGAEESGCGLRDDEWEFRCYRLDHTSGGYANPDTDGRRCSGRPPQLRPRSLVRVNAHETGLLRSLRSVRTQPTRFKMQWEPDNRPETVRAILPRNVDTVHDPGLGIDPHCLHTFDIQNVEVLEYSDDNGIWFKLLKASHGSWTEDTLPHDQKCFRSLKSLKLHESRTTPSSLRYLLDEAHSLEIFHYTTRQQEWKQDYWCPQYVDYEFMPSDFFSMNGTVRYGVSGRL